LHSASQHNLLYIITNWFKWDKRGTLLMFLRVPVMIVIPTVNALIPKLMIDAITAHAPLRQFVAMMLGVTLLVALLSLLDPALNQKSISVWFNINTHYSILTFEKLLRMDYANLESYEGRLRFERSKKFALSGQRRSPGVNSLFALVGLCTNALGITAYLVLLHQVNGWLLLIIAVTCVLEFFCYHWLSRVQIKANDRTAPHELRFTYFFRLATDPKPGKDIRITGAKDWLLRLLAQAMAGYVKVLRWQTKQEIRISALQALCSFVRDGATFAFLIYAVLQKQMNAANFLFSFGLITGFSGWLNGISRQVNILKEAADECQKFRDFLDMPDSQTARLIPPPLDGVENIEIRHVSFSYDEEGDVLHDINLSVAKGEKIAIVGENGAGKTTLIKLLCGLYAPAGGQILINGTDIATFDREAYFALFSAVFQDYTFLPDSILSNIAISEQADEEQVWAVLQKAGLAEKIKSLERQLQANLIKQLNDEAVDLSGGEKQRLLLARALYKNAPVLILDEPTAALDPIAEERLYEQYNEHTEDKIAFYISHRLSSTRFCDRIIYMRSGRIAETGTHEELMDLRGGYWQMYQTQGYYYRQEANQQKEVATA